jgi:hypothetical protein
MLGSSSAPIVTAMPGGKTFTGAASGSAALFPVIATALKITPTSVSADMTTNAQGANFSIDVINQSSSVGVTIPGLGIGNLELTPSDSTPSGGTIYAGQNGVNHLNLWADDFDYVAYGHWEYFNSNSGFPGGGNEGFYVLGYQTPINAMPTSGSATYLGKTNGSTFSPSGPGQGLFISGDASVTVNFGTNAVSGSLTNMTVVAPGGNQPWNDVSLSGALTGATFSGTTAATSAGGGNLSLKASATGTMSGAVFGPAAQNVGAVWTLFDGTSAAAGSLGAKQAPSDRRLKRDVRLEQITAVGLRLYSFRYLADDRRFRGVMAQDLLEDRRFAHAVTANAHGLLAVDYDAIGAVPADFAAMQAAGLAAIAAYEARTSA